MPNEGANSSEAANKAEGQKGEGSPTSPDMIPRERLNQEISKKNDAEQRAARAEGRLDQLTMDQSKKSEESREHSPAEIRTMVEEGKLSQEAADVYLIEQTQEKAAEAGRQAATTAVQTEQRITKLKTDLGTYHSKIPQSKIDGTPERTALLREAAALVDLGLPSDAAETEVAAYRAAFGPPDAIQGKGRVKADPYPETTGGGDGGEGGGGGDNKAITSLTPKQREYGQKMVDMGRFKDLAAYAESVDKWGKPGFSKGA